MAKKEHCYEGIRFTQSAHDGCFCAVNPQFLALVVESAGGGAFVVLPLDKMGRADVNTPRVCGHRGPITDIKWNPFDDNVIASSSEDATIKVWCIPDGGLVDNLTACTADLVGHSKKVSYIEWHPVAADILLSASADLQCIIWNVADESAVGHICVHHDTIYSMSWNHIGSAFATTSKDRIIRVIDPRSGIVIAQGDGHQGSKASKVAFLGRQNRLFTTGFSRHSERQYAVWDASNLSEPLHIEVIDASSGLLIPFFDADTNVVYVAGKGDGNIRYFEVVDKAPYVYFLSQYTSDKPQRGLGMLPKRGVDTASCELVRFYKMHAQKDVCEPISMIVPRKAETYQSDIYPPTASTHPSLTAAQWLSGVNREPILISLKDGRELPSNEHSLPATNASAMSAAGAKGNAASKHRSNSNSSAVSQADERINEPVVNGHSSSTASAAHTVLAAGPHQSRTGAEHTSQQHRGVDSTTASTVVTSSCSSLSHDDRPTPDTQVMSAPFTSAKVIVRRSKSVTAGLSSSTPTVTRLSRQTSDASPPPASASISHDITPVSAGRYPRRRVRQRREDDNSSSCSSTEALNHQPDDVWKDNPLYADQRRQRQRQQKMLGIRRTQHVMDAGPHDDVFMETRPQPPADAAGFKSDPVLLDTMIIQNSTSTPESDICRGSMIDCISVAAPDDTVIKPSQLRESMRQRRTPPCRSSTDDTAVNDHSPSVWRAGSLRETKRTPSVEGEAGFVRKKVAAIDVSSSAAPAAVVNSDSRSLETTTKSSSSVSPSSAGPYTFSVPMSSENTHKKTLQSPKTPQETNGTASVSYEQLLHSYNQLRKKYTADVMVLRQQLESKDSRIRSLEEQLQSLRSSDGTSYSASVKGVY